MFLRFAFFVLGITLAAASAADAQEKSRIEIVPQLGHSGSVYSIAIAPDGKTALSGSWDHTLRLWDLASGREIKKFEGHSGFVSSVAFAPDGKTALSGSWDGTVRLWDLQSANLWLPCWARVMAISSPSRRPGSTPRPARAWTKCCMWFAASKPTPSFSFTINSTDPSLSASALRGM
jgi:WD40 repeat protein